MMMMGAWVRAASCMVLLFNFISLCSGGAYEQTVGVHGCSSKERKALLEFKQALTDPFNRLSSWAPDGDDCCQWAGVGCDNITGVVTELDLCGYFGPSLGGDISPSLLQLESLTHLDLSWNDFNGTSIPSFFGSIKSLRELNLEGALFGGVVPSQLQNLSRIRYLNLGNNHGLRADSLGWIAHLRSLEFLDMSDVDLHGVEADWLQTVSMPPYLSDLHFTNCKLDSMIPPPLGHVNFSSLQSLGLGENGISSKIPGWLFNLSTSLRKLYLWENSLYGELPEMITTLRLLERLELNDNYLTGSIPPGIGQLKHLETLDLGSNILSGSIPWSISNLTSLRSLDLGSNNLSGTISDIVPNWFWELASGIEDFINLSGNQIHGDLTHAWFNSTSIDISSNYFTGQLPHLSPNVRALSIRNNSVSEPISTFICGESNRNNKLEYLDISMNKLSGELSECWMHWQSLVHLNLGHNNLSGKIPATIGSLYNLKALQLSQNRLFGDIPLSLSNCTRLGFINLAENNLSGSIPNWIGEQKAMLFVLRLRSNRFTGSIPVQFCQLSSIQVLDLGNNNLSGTIPKCIGDLHSMVDEPSNRLVIPPTFRYRQPYVLFLESLDLFTKGTESIYQRNLVLVRMIDFSNNMLSGTIPTNISRFVGLRFLNLSRNHLVGEMPKEIGNMTNLESLDLSRNQLSGEIPKSMSELSFLNNLDLSYNNLSGSIPLSTQLQSFEESSFLGNVGLCGAPLSKPCRNDNHQEPKEDAGGSDDHMFWFYIGAGPGFAGAFCGYCSVLYFKPAWRQALFWFLEDLMNNVYVFAYVKMNRIKRRLKRSDNTAAG